MKLWVLGSGTLRPDPLRGSPGYWLECGSHRILLDCGPGTARSLAVLGRSWPEITHLFISHFHTDHVGGLAPLLFALRHGLSEPRSAPLTLLGPEGLKKWMTALSCAMGEYVQDPGFPLEVVELASDDRWAPPGSPFHLLVHPTPHTPESLALRVEARGWIVGYTGDTGPDRTLGKFMNGCHVLLAECSHGDDEQMPNHLTPRSLLQLARTAEPGLLVPVHVYPPLHPGRIPELLHAQGYEGEVVPGADGMVVIMDRGKIRVDSSSAQA